MGKDCRQTVQKVWTHTRKHTSRQRCWHHLCLPWNKFSAAWKRLDGDVFRKKVNVRVQTVSDWSTSPFCYTPLLWGKNQLLLCAQEEKLYPLELFQLKECCVSIYSNTSIPCATTRRDWRLSKEAEFSCHHQLKPSSSQLKPTRALQHSRCFHVTDSAVLWNSSVLVPYASLPTPCP